MSHGRVLWHDAMAHEGERISIFNIRQATAKRPDLRTRVHTHIQAEMKRSEEHRRIMGVDLNVATSCTGYSISTKYHFEKADNQFQEFVQRTRGSLVESEARAKIWWVLQHSMISKVKHLTASQHGIFSIMTWPKRQCQIVQCIG